MTLQVTKNFFRSKNEVLDDMKAADSWPTMYVGGASAGRAVHAHGMDLTVYVMDGEADFIDGETDTSFHLIPGDKLVIPAGALHAEGEVKERIVYLVGFPGPMSPDEIPADEIAAR